MNREIAFRLKYVSARMATFISLLAAFTAFGLKADAATVYAIANGNFNSGLTWSTGVPPSNTDSVVIDDDYKVTVTADDTVGSICVYANTSGSISRLIINTGVTLVVNEYFRVHSDGIDPFDDPTCQVQVRGTLSVGKDLILQTYDDVATDPSLAVIKMIYANGNLLLYRNIINVGAGGQIDASSVNASTTKFLGSTSTTLTVTSNFKFHHIVVDKSSGATLTLGGGLNTANFFGNLTLQNGKFDNGGYSINGTSGKSFTQQSGTTFILSGSSSLPANLNYVINSGSTIQFSGTNTIGSPSGDDYENLTISGTGTKTLGTNITINGNLNLAGGTLDANNTLNYGITIKGNWVNSGGTFQPRAGTVTFSGSSDQTITSNGNSFYNITINNTGTQVSLNDNLTVSNVLTLTDGVITTGSYRVILTSTSAAAVTGQSSASFINGNLRRYIASNTATYAFPVGNGTASTNYFRVDVINNNLTGLSYIDARFKPLTRHDDDSLNVSDTWSGGSLTYNTVNNAGIWELEPNATPTGGSYNIRLYTENMSGLTDNLFGPLKRPLNSYTSGWTTGGGSLSNNNGDGRLVSHGYALRSGLTSFSEFGVGGGSQSGSGLPIELVSFTAVPHGKVVKIKWVTASEINNDFFTVERSANAITFETLNTFSGAGNSSVTNAYEMTDYHPLPGISYYRLKQTDFDGTYTYSRVVSVHFEEEASMVSVFPNPVRENKFFIKLENIPDAADVAHIHIIDLNGKPAYSATFDLFHSGVRQIELPANLPRGMYFLELTGVQGLGKQKLLVY
ncbi:MAG: hypothetical protein KatS3mg031_2607 [Chitinophagales bacterium]|nr:MAG: hypothetical protein KatS3mg031_2607 [Chitinophagales bacterium]